MKRPAFFPIFLPLITTRMLISPQPELLPDVFCLLVRIIRLMLVLLYIYKQYQYSSNYDYKQDIYENQNLLSLQLVSFLVGLRTQQLCRYVTHSHNHIRFILYITRRSQWPRGLRRVYAAARYLRLGVRIPPLAWTSVSTEGDVSECDREASVMRRPWFTRGCCAMGAGGDFLT